MNDGTSSARRSTYSLAIAFLATATAAFLGMRWNMLEPRWAFPLGTKVMLLAALVSAGLSRVLGRSRPGATTLIVGIAVPIGAFISMFLGMLGDPTAQNLWPVSVVVLGIVGLAASLVGVIAGSLVLRLSKAWVHPGEGGM